ncbi:hypothetical protein GLP59_01510 [Sulfitobacter sp. M220]|jgi:hypothetical protein|uniref:Uncharacterized protein n=2 Tax=Sulfitobacter litoralis TaxID=335975 RepID=A0ABY0RNF6_9RHOB|nr:MULTISPECIES: hypothetical protein [Sulfitobacter]MBQ0717181.1 hypothetical protein [Sulfitobacter litoralis]MBQ0800348.1 hypothetical protein [Sulfitobacter litoralis]MCF7727865.1 hypothetical protein [Sulfitobacter sp. M22]MCF7776344.1 hypothetical protein [Sulfitobacter sp. M220]SDO32366.1 hypothetical protein SAMN04488512_102116 [Sulfitobacter litoralis]|tara:strand:- start:285 stop:1001 length:717 start_codon:yes stop_codon:yes gene_type:complete
MTLLSFQSGERFIASSSEALRKAGITLTVGYDFRVYKELLEDARPDHLIGLPFDPVAHDLSENNAFWVVGRNSKGEIMHTQAMRMLALKGAKLAEYLRRSFVEFPPPGVDIDFHRSRYRAGPGSHRIAGDVCYHGEFWVGATPREFKTAGLSSLLGRYAFWQAMQHWDPDHIIAFMTNAVVYKGFPARHGYMHTEPGTLRWFINGQDAPVEGFMAYMDREDLRFILDMPLSDRSSRAA